mgnify:CR=1 FL=1
MEAKKIHELIMGYGLLDALQNRLNVVISGGIARSTIYKAFQVGPKTPRTKMVLQVAETVIAEHEKNVAEAVIALS